MKIDETILKQVKDEYGKMYGYATRGDMEMLAWCIKKIGGVARLANGLFFVVEKPDVETKFCFGYGLNGVADEKSFQSANDAKDSMSQKENFIGANLEEFDRHYRLLTSGKDVYYYRESRNRKTPPTNLVGLSESMNAYYGCIGKVSKEDLDTIKAEVARVREDFAKRLETYWKRYGSSKLKTWTYLVD